jgi:hypothetical protein
LEYTQLPGEWEAAMEFARNLLIKAVDTVAPPPAPARQQLWRPRAILPAPDNAPENPPQEEQQNVSRRLAVAWFFIVGGALILCVVLWWLLGWIFGNHRAAFYLDVVICSFVIGFGFVFICAARYVAAIFGALAGSGVQNAATSEGVITQANVIIAKLIAGVSYLSPDAAGLGPDTLWLGACIFYGLVLVWSAPSLFSK